jgi:hypothetical protein
MAEVLAVDAQTRDGELVGGDVVNQFRSVPDYFGPKRLLGDRVEVQDPQ